MKRLFLLNFILLLIIPGFSHAAGADLAISKNDIRFSESTLVSGDEVRIYASVRNAGDVDATGYVYFYQGTTPLGSSQVVTVVAGGNDEDVWIDFTVPYGDFNVRAELKGVEPTDTDASNDLAVTALFSPVADEDHDGVTDENDNCPDAANADQQDSDGDGAGDACDNDDDNDTLSDDVEDDLGTDPTSADTDGDGVSDAQDAYPLDDSRFEQEVVTDEEGVEDDSPDDSEVAAESSPADAQQEASSEDTSGEDVDASTDELSDISIELSSDLLIDELTLEALEAEDIFPTSVRAGFIAVQEDWRTYAFRSLYGGSSAHIEWDFGDGTTSANAQVAHEFRKPGSYTVTLRISTPNEEVVDTQVIEISPFHLSNPLVLLLLGLLGMLFVIALVVAFPRKHPVLGRSMDTASSGDDNNEKTRAKASAKPVVKREQKPVKGAVQPTVVQISDQDLVSDNDLHLDIDPAKDQQAIAAAKAKAKALAGSVGESTKKTTKKSAAKKKSPAKKKTTKKVTTKKKTGLAAKKQTGLAAKKKTTTTKKTSSRSKK